MTSSTAVRATAFTGLPSRAFRSIPIGSGVDHFINGMGIDVAYLGKQRAHGHDLLLLPRLQLRQQLHASRRDSRLLIMADRRGPPAGSWFADAVELVAKYLLRQDGRRLRRDGLSRGRPSFPDLGAGLRTGRQPLSGSHLHLVVRIHAGRDASPQMSSAGEKPIPGIKSDHPARTYFERDNERPNQPSQTPPRD